MAITTAFVAAQALVAGDHGALAVERPAAAEELDPALLQPRQLAGVVAVVDHLVAAREDQLRVELSGDHLADARDPLDLGSSSPGRSSAFEGMQA